MASQHLFSAAMPLATHWETAECDEVSCPHYLLGWRTLVDETTELGQMQAHYIRVSAGRRFVESQDPEGLTVFVFERGQQCFRDHQQHTDRPAILTHDNRVHIRPADWQEDFNETVQPIKRLIEGG